MPEGAVISDGENDDDGPNDDPHRALDINLDELILFFVTRLSLVINYIQQIQIKKLYVIFSDP